MVWPLHVREATSLLPLGLYVLNRAAAAAGVILVRGRSAHNSFPPCLRNRNTDLGVGGGTQMPSLAWLLCACLKVELRMGTQPMTVTVTVTVAVTVAVTPREHNTALWYRFNLIEMTLYATAVVWLQVGCCCCRVL